VGTAGRAADRRQPRFRDQSDVKITPAGRLRRTLVWYSFGTACCVALVIGVVLVLQDHTLNASQVSSSIGLNLIGSVVFAIMFALLANWVQDRNVQETISEGFGELTDRVTQNMARTNRLFLPAKRYEALNPTDSFGDDYNLDLTVELEDTGFFAFYGPSARYVAARLLATRHHPQQIRVAMIGPANRRAISRRASDRASWLKSQGQPIEEIGRQLEDELLMNIVSLFDCRRLCPIEILYNDDTAVYRYVMLDQSVYVSWYHSAQSAQMEMPESYRFGKDSFVYSTFRMDLMRKFEISTDKVIFEAGDDDAVLIAHLRGLTGRTITDEDLDRWRTEQRRDSAAFLGYLTTLYGDLHHQDGRAKAKPARPSDDVRSESTLRHWPD
jgi:hypothetical protein